MVELTHDVQDIIERPLNGISPEDVQILLRSPNIQRALAFQPDEFMIQKVCATNDWDEEQALEIFEETKRFLVISYVLDRHFCPSKPVDEMWHMWVLFSQNYFSFCEKIGAYIHHSPLPVGSPKQPPVEPTVEAMQVAFGPLSELAWPAELGAFGGRDCCAGPW